MRLPHSATCGCLSSAGPLLLLITATATATPSVPAPAAAPDPAIAPAPAPSPAPAPCCLLPAAAATAATAAATAVCACACACSCYCRTAAAATAADASLILLPFFFDAMFSTTPPMPGPAPTSWPLLRQNHNHILTLMVKTMPTRRTTQPGCSGPVTNIGNTIAVTQPKLEVLFRAF